MNLLDDIVDEILNKFKITENKFKNIISKGWEHHVKLYNKDNRKSTNLFLLDFLRKKIIDVYLNQYQKSMIGSTNITSDYDVTIYVDVFKTTNIQNDIYKLNNDLYSKYKTDILKAFDMNFYLYNNIYPQKSLDKHFYKINDVYNNILLLKADKSNYKLQLNYILLKWIKCKLPHKKFITKKIIKKYETLNKDIINKDIINTYNLQSEYAYKSKYNLLNNNYSKYIDNTLKARYYSLEGYYSISTLQIVLYEISKSKKLKSNFYDYILCIIENWLDLYSHISHYKIINESMLLKASKYIYRIYFCWYKIIKTKFFKKKEDEILVKIRYCFNNFNLYEIIINIINFRNKNVGNKKEIMELLHRSFGLYCDKNYNSSIKFNINNLKKELIEQVSFLINMGGKYKNDKYTKRK